MTNGLEELVLYFSLKYEGDFQKIYEAVMSKEKVDEKLKKELMEKLKCKYVTIFSEDYPEMLKQINCPPFVLFYYGDLKLLDTATVAVEGTVNPTDFNFQFSCFRYNVSSCTSMNSSNIHTCLTITVTRNRV